MGRWPWSSRVTIEQCVNLDINWLSRESVLTRFYHGNLEWKNYGGEVTAGVCLRASVGWGTGNDHLRLIYTNTDCTTGEKTDVNYRIDLVAIPCHFGGERFWFVCPLNIKGLPCLRRVGKLYLPPRATYFGCRHCYNLTYRCQKEHDLPQFHFVTTLGKGQAP